MLISRFYLGLYFPCTTLQSNSKQAIETFHTHTLTKPARGGREVSFEFGDPCINGPRVAAYWTALSFTIKWVTLQNNGHYSDKRSCGRINRRCIQLMWFQGLWVVSFNSETGNPLPADTC